MINYCNFYILDSAQIETELTLAQKLNSDGRCLYVGESEQSLKYVAPYLFSFQVGNDFSNWVVHMKKQCNLGYFINTKASFEQLYRHLRTLLFVQTEENEELYFRFYDPFVARIFLPTCDAAQIREFFGPINFLVLETETPGMYKQYWHENGVLREKEFEYQVEEIAQLDKKIVQLKLEIDAEQEQKDREEVARINHLYNKDEKVIIPDTKNENVRPAPEENKAEFSTKEELPRREVIKQSSFFGDSKREADTEDTKPIDALPKTTAEKKNKGWRLFD
jgi:hypothetical protein